MSIVLKSNVTAKNSLGTYKSLISDPVVEFTTYKSRVIADGGTVISDSSTLNAFKFLIENGIYGLARTYIGAAYGMKRDVNGNITKLYSLDGEDLVAYNIGGGLPVTLTNNEILFTNEVKDALSQTKGTIFTTASKIGLKGRGLVTGISGSKLVTSTVAEAGIAGLTLLDSVNNSTPLWFITLPKSSDLITSGRQIGEKPNQNDSSTTARVNASLYATGSKYVYFADQKKQMLKGYRDGVLTTLPAAAQQFSNLDGFSGYLNFGGLVYWTGNGKEYRLGNGSFKQFFVYDDLPEAKVELLAKT